MTLYEELELPNTCTFDEIKQKYRLLAQKYHPDKGGDEEKFKRIKTAYETLIDPKKRQTYDNTGEYYEDTSISNEVTTRLNNMITYWTKQINPDLDDLILKMKVDIYQAQTQTNNSIVECQFIIKKLNTISNKIKLKNNGVNLLKNMVDEKIKLLENELSNYRRTLVVFEEMLDILNNYHYSIDEWMLLIK